MSTIPLRRSLSVLLLAAAVLTGPARPADATTQQRWTPHLTGIGTATQAGDTARERAIAAELVDKVNDERAARGIGPLAVHPDLTIAAADWARQEAIAGDQTHAPWGQVAPGWTGGENLNYARGVAADGTDHTSAQSLHLAWMRSDGHRDNMLWVDWTHVGIAVECDAAGGIWVVARFGRPDDGRATTDPAAYPTGPSPLTHPEPTGGTSCTTARAPQAQRTAGAGRFETAATLSRAAWPATDNPLGHGTVKGSRGGADQLVLVASGDTYPDALSASSAAASLGVPLLLVGRDRVPTATAAELDRIDPDRIVVIGGPAAVADQVAADLSAWAPVERLGGADRAATSRIVARRLWQDRPQWTSRLYLVDADDWAAAMVAATNGPFPVVAVSAIDGRLAELVDDLEVESVVLVGDLAGRDDVADDVADLVGSRPVRIGASDPTGLSVAFASTLSHRQAAVVASSESFADALTMAATAWRTRSALLLADPACPHGRADGRILSHIDTLQSGVVTLIGGEAALPSCVVDGL